MSVHSSMKRSIAVALVVTFACAMAAAQYDEDRGQYQILSARYGTERNNVDVTDTLRQLAQQDVAFRMGNSTFGIDPDPGVVKTLRIFARGRAGGVRVFEYREGSTIDGSLFTGWGGGGWGRDRWNGGWYGGDEGQYRIVHARYGTERHNVDVTDRLRQLAQQDVTFRMGNSTFGIDPDPGIVKNLRIFARDRDGRPRTFEYREGSTIDGSLFTGWGGGDWGNERWNGGWGSGWENSGYGGGGGSHDRDRDHDGDHDRDRDHDGDHDRDRGRWGDRGQQAATLQIVRATYGSGRNSRDVTGRLRSFINNGRLDLTVNNDSMGGDPAPNQRKTLTITYSTDRGQRQATVGENGRLSIP